MREMNKLHFWIGHSNRAGGVGHRRILTNGGKGADEVDIAGTRASVDCDHLEIKPIGTGEK